MSTVTGVGSSSYLGSQVASASSMGKSEFLNLLVTQLSNQDPLNPMDNQQFAAQLAQFSSLELMTNMQGTLEDNLTASQSVATALQGGMAADLVGSTVTALDDRVVLADGAATLRWETESTPASLEIEILDSTGAVVRRQTLSAPEESSWNWDGSDGAGEELADGTYTIRLSATDSAGEDLTVRPLWSGRVDSVRFREGVPYLVSRGEEFTLGQVSEVSADEEDGSPAQDARNDWNW
ncbi:MAG: flagellar hook capping FlgD N-terminal domain-containing protein [Candidatus Delongbacteria bacterium]